MSPRRQYALKSLRLSIILKVSYYDRRMGIEEQFRDAKGQRSGLKLRWTQFTRAEFVERMHLMAGVALLLWTSVGRAVEEPEPAVVLESKLPGVNSLARITRRW